MSQTNIFISVGGKFLIHFIYFFFVRFFSYEKKAFKKTIMQQFFHDEFPGGQLGPEPPRDREQSIAQFETNGKFQVGMSS